MVLIMAAAILVWLRGSLCSEDILRLLNMATVIECGTGAVASISMRGWVVVWLASMVCRLILKWRRLLMIIRLRLVN